MLSPSSATSSSPRISPITRLRNARQIHEQLQERTWTERGSSTPRSDVKETGTNPVDVDGVLHTHRLHTLVHPQRYPLDHTAPANVEALTKDLQQMWLKQQEGTHGPLLKKIEKIGVHEKDGIIMHLLQQTGYLQAQRNDVVAVGEKLTTQLVQQQHELRGQFKAQTTQLQEQLHQALNHHPEVARLEQKIAELQRTNRECEQKLLFAAQKLHQSRQRERALRLEHENDPLLWGL